VQTSNHKYALHPFLTFSFDVVSSLSSSSSFCLGGFWSATTQPQLMQVKKLPLLLLQSSGSQDDHYSEDDFNEVLMACNSKMRFDICISKIFDMKKTL
jgi:hypothetical protein